MKKIMFLFMAAMLCSTVASAGWSYVCASAWVEHTVENQVDAHWELDAYTGQWILVPAGWEAQLVGGWEETCYWVTTPDPPPSDGTPTPPPPYTPPALVAAQLWIEQLSDDDPRAATILIGVSHASDVACDFNNLIVRVDGQYTSGLSGEFPYESNIGRLDIASYSYGTHTVEVTAYSPCGTVATSAFEMTRQSSGAGNTSGYLTLLNVDSGDNGVGDSYPVGTFWGCPRFLSEQLIRTTYSVGNNPGMSNYQIQRGYSALDPATAGGFPGTPIYSDHHTVDGTNMGSVSEEMQIDGMGFGWDGRYTKTAPIGSGTAMGRALTCTSSIWDFYFGMYTGMQHMFVAPTSHDLTLFIYQ